MMTAAELAAGVKAWPAGGGWLACCPAHDDRKPSLSIDSGDDGRVLLHCHAGCEVEAVCAALGITTADLFPQGNGTSVKGRIVAKYPYVDETGALLFEVVRFEPKDFRQRKPDGRGGWTWNLKGVRRVPYRLNELAGADEVFIVEGEKDVDNLRALGFVATTVPGGAEKWRAEYADAFRDGQDVVVIADNDDAGMKGAHKIAAALRGVVASVRILELPDLPAKGDVSDFIATFNDREAAAERLAIMAADAPIFDGDGEQQHPQEGRIVELVSAATITPERTTYVWVDRVVAGDVNLLVGPPGVGKGNITVGWAARLTQGDLAGDLYGSPRNVIIASAEDSPAHAIVPRLLAVDADMSRVHIVCVTDDQCEVCMTLPDDVPELVELVKRVDAALLIIDPVMAHLSGKVDSHRDASLRRALAPLSRLAHGTGVAVVGVAHTNKAQSTDWLRRVGGSIGVSGAARNVLMAGDDPEGNERLLAHPKSNTGEQAPTLRYRIEGREIHHDGERIETCAVVWRGVAEGVTAADMLGENEPEQRRERDEAAKWLEAYLRDRGGEAPAGETIKAAREDGIAKTTLYRARKATGVKSRKSGVRGAWVWTLEADASASEDSAASRDEEPGTLESSGETGDGSNPESPQDSTTHEDYTFQVTGRAESSASDENGAGGGGPPQEPERLASMTWQQELAARRREIARSATPGA